MVWWTFLVGYILISGFGVAVGYHRHFSHKSFVTSRVIQACLLYLGSLACQGSVIFWVATHRAKHHRWADVAGKDAHTPIDGWFHAYIGWILKLGKGPLITNARGITDLLRDPIVVAFSERYVKLISLTWIITWIIDPKIFFGLVLAQLYAFHQEMIIDLFCHLRWFGYRNFNTNDNSVNSLIGYLTWGQGWHNNHHANPSNFNFGYRGWEIDPAVWLVKLIRCK